MEQELQDLLTYLADHEASLRLTGPGKLSVKPRPDDATLARIREHKADLIGVVIEATEEGAEVSICRACVKPIPEHEPCISVERDGEGKRYPYHADPECQAEAAIFVLRMIQENLGSVFWTHLHHVCGDEESGYNCKGGCFT
jgi:hypothetical protein